VTSPLPLGRTIRRVVTGHDADGKAVVLLDGPATNVRRGAPTLNSTLLWSSDQMPADIAAGLQPEDMGNRVLGIQPAPNGTRFVINDIAPGGTPMHRTETIDYVIVLDGEIDLDLPEESVRLRAGDVVVQRGTDHAWVNRSESVARIGVVLIDAVPLGIEHA